MIGAATGGSGADEIGFSTARLDATGLGIYDSAPATLTRASEFSRDRDAGTRAAQRFKGDLPSTLTVNLLLLVVQRQAARASPRFSASRLA